MPFKLSENYIPIFILGFRKQMKMRKCGSSNKASIILNVD